MRYMVIERYIAGPGPVYERAARHGRMLPAGLRIIDRWVVDDERLERCFQLMETDDPALLGVWRARWSDLGTLEIYLVIDSATAAARVGIGWPADPDR
jgi:hypothetical protein